MSNEVKEEDIFHVVFVQDSETGQKLDEKFFRDAVKARANYEKRKKTFLTDYKCHEDMSINIRKCIFSD